MIKFWSEMGLDPGQIAGVDQLEAEASDQLDTVVDAMVTCYQQLGQLSPSSLGAKIMLETFEALDASDADEIRNNLFHYLLILATAINRLAQIRIDGIAPAVDS